MDTSRTGDPVRLGPFTVVSRLERAVGPEWAGTDVRLLGREAVSGRTVVLTVPADGLAQDATYVQRFRVEAANSLTIHAPWLYRTTDVADMTGPAWHAADYVPQLGLPAALSALAGPLPVDAVRALGVALAETLTVLHATGQVHAGILPGNVRITAQGPLLTGYGAVRVASVEGTDRGFTPGLNTHHLAPELLTGGRPRPAGDIYALGALLVYAATAHSPFADPEEDLTPTELAHRILHGQPQLAALPQELRGPLARCLSRDAAHRPTAADLTTLLTAASTPRPATTHTLVLGRSTRPSHAADPHTLLLGPPPKPTTPPRGTTPTRSATALSPAWLPGRLIAALSEQASQALAAENPPGLEVPERPAEPPSSPGTSLATPDNTSGGGRTSRRSVLIGALSGAAGVAVGATGYLAWEPGIDQSSAASAKPTRRPQVPPGTKRVAPAPLWHYRFPGKAPERPPAVWNDRVAVVSTENGVVGLDVRTGKKLWDRSELSVPGRPHVTEDGQIVLIASLDQLVSLDPRKGSVQWREENYTGEESPSARTLTALAVVEGKTAWCITEGKDDKALKHHELLAYDLGSRKELWSYPLKDSVGQVVLDGPLIFTQKREIIVVDGGKEPDFDDRPDDLTFLGIDQASGKRNWSKKLKGCPADAMFVPTAEGHVLIADRKKLTLVQMRSGDALWTFTPPKGREVGWPVVQGNTVYATDTVSGVYALDAKSGESKWDSSLGFAFARALHGESLDFSRSGRTLLYCNQSEMDAFDTVTGDLLWRFADHAVTDGTPGEPVAMLAFTDDAVLVLSGTDLYALPVE